MTTGKFSANRSTKATLTLTKPGHIKSSANDLSLPIFEIMIAHQRPLAAEGGAYAVGASPISFHGILKAVDNAAYPAWIPA